MVYLLRWFVMATSRGTIQRRMSRSRSRRSGSEMTPNQMRASTFVEPMTSNVTPLMTHRRRRARHGTLTIKAMPEVSLGFSWYLYIPLYRSNQMRDPE